jgi:hypothetical protein
MDRLAGALPVFLAACFSVGIAYQIGRLMAQGAMGAFWFFAFSDYVNFSIPSVLVLVGIFAFLVVSGLPHMGIEALFGLRKNAPEQPASLAPRPSPTSVPTKRALLLGRAVKIIAVIGLWGLPLSFTWRQGKFSWPEAIAWAAFLAISAGLVRLWRMTESLPSDAQLPPQAIVIALWAVHLSFFVALGLSGEDPTKPGFTVTIVNSDATKPTVLRRAPHDVIPVDRGVILITAGKLELIPWSEVKSVERL